MFYSQCLLSKKGPLGAIWVAAYFFKKLKKAQVKATDIPSSVDVILQNEIDAVAYRVLAYLLLGVVRIYSKKVDYLFNDCNKLLIGVKDVVVKEKHKASKEIVPAPCLAIALPERFELDAFDLDILEEFHGGNVRPLEDITLRDGAWKSENNGQYSMEQFDPEEIAPTREICWTDHDKNKIGWYSHETDIDMENVTGDNVSKEDTANAETFCASENESSDPKRFSTDKDKQMEDSELNNEPEAGSMEKIRNDEFHQQEFVSPETIHGIEKQHSDNLQTDNMEALLEMSETVEDTADHNENHSSAENTIFCHLTVSVNDNHSNTKDTPVLSMHDAPTPLKVPETSEAATPQFTIIPTPALKEGARVSRKRKCLIDDKVVLSNSFMKRFIDDTSELITRRRKVPRTALDAWRQYRLSSRSHCFLDPLIKYSSSELQSLFLQKEAEVSQSSEPHASSRRSKTPEYSRVNDSPIQLAVVPETLETPKAAEDSEQAGMAPETPVREPKSFVFLKSPESPANKETRPEKSSKSSNEEQPSPGNDKDFDMSLLCGTTDDGDPQQDGWSGRTRKVAKCLEKIFMNQRQRGEEGTVSLLQICRGRTKKESARLFYEILVLKTRGHVEVKQEEAYGEILALQASSGCLSC